MTTNLINSVLETGLAQPPISEIPPSRKISDYLPPRTSGKVTFSTSGAGGFHSYHQTMPVEGAIAAAEVTWKRDKSQEELETLKLLGAGIAHDLGNILTVLVGNIELAQLSEAQGEGQSELWYSLEKMEGAVSMAKALHAQLHQLFKGTPLLKESVALAELVKEATRLGLFGAVGIECHVRVSNALPLIKVERCQISQVIQNLVLNAVQAMPAGGQLEIAAEEVELVEGQVATLKAGKFVEITVSDTGMGIAPEHLSTIFAPHFTTKAKGQGLGLAMCFSIIQRHQGHIRVESQVGVGTTFRVWLPLTESEL